MNKINKYICVFLVLFVFPLTIGLSQTTPPVTVPVPEIPVAEGIPVTIPGGGMVHITTPSGVVINVTVGSDVSITVNIFSQNGIGTVIPPNMSLDIFVDISLDDDVSVDALIVIPYTESLLFEANIEQEEDLKLAYYNDVSETWKVVSSTVDTVDNVVYANTNHFSLWTIVVSNGGFTSELPVIPMFFGLLAISIVIRKRTTRNK